MKSWKHSTAKLVRLSEIFWLSNLNDFSVLQVVARKFVKFVTQFTDKRTLEQLIKYCSNNLQKQPLPGVL